MALAVAFAAAVLAAFIISRNVTPDYTTGLFGEHLENAVRLKAQLATAILGLALLQLVLALLMYRRHARAATVSRAVPRAHRVIGTLTFVFTIPVAVHCSETYGIELTPVRAAIHSVSACFFYGAFAAKVVFVQSPRLNEWLPPLVGGLLVVAIVFIWYTSALWFFNGDSVPCGTGVRRARGAAAQ